MREGGREEEGRSKGAGREEGGRIEEKGGKKGGERVEGWRRGSRRED